MGLKTLSSPVDPNSRQHLEPIRVLGDKCPGLKFDHCPQYSTEAGNEWSCTSTPATCPHEVSRDKFTLPFTGTRKGAIYIIILLKS